MARFSGVRSKAILILDHILSHLLSNIKALLTNEEIDDISIIEGEASVDKVKEALGKLRRH